MVIIHTHQSVPETNYICFTPNTTRRPAPISPLMAAIGTNL